MPEARLTAVIRRAVLVVLLGTVLAPGQMPAQEASTSGAQLHWWHGVVALGGYALLTQVDDEIQQFVRDNRSPTSDDVAKVTRQVGQPEVYATVGLGVLATGLISGDRKIRNAGLRISGSLALTGAVVTIAKLAVGRSRPSRAGSNADDFSPFSGNRSAPSGHSAMAFALATSVSSELRNPWVTAGLYTLATATAWSRVNDDVHWFSDVVGGAAVGIVSARFMTGRMTIFGVRPPVLTPTSTGVALSWSGAF